MTNLTKEDEELIADGTMYVDEYGKKCLAFQESPEKANMIRNFGSTENTVLVLGYPKAGSHLTLSILDELGVDRIEDLKAGDEQITSAPFEYQLGMNPKAYEIMERRLNATSDLLILPHCHLAPNYFPTNFRGKIIFIERDSRSIAVSAYHFFSKLSWLKPMMEKYQANDVNRFSQLMFQNKLWIGRNEDYNNKWHTYFDQSSYSVLRLKYEDIIDDKASNIKRIAQFMQVENYDLDKIITNTSVEKTKETRQKKFDAAGRPFFEAVCYRTGKKNAWSDCLSDETLQIYEQSLN